MKKTIILFLLIIATSLLFSGCGKKKSDTLDPPFQGTTVRDITFKGDDMAKNLGAAWGGNIENDGETNATVSHLLDFPDNRILKTVILFVGIFDLGKEQQTADETLPQYTQLYNSIQAAQIFCVGILPVTDTAPYNSSLWPEIFKLNQGIKTLCGDTHYIDTWIIPFTSQDGIHPDAAMNALIKAKIVALSG